MSKTVKFLILLILAAVFVFGVFPASFVARYKESDQPLQPQNGSGIYPSPAHTVLGVEMLNINVEGGLDYVKQTNVRFVRKNGLIWSLVEASKGQRDWDSQAQLEQELKSAAAQNWDVILVIRSTPSWAQADPPWHCGTMQTDAVPAFGNFVRDAVERYSQPPFLVKYFEIWNEEDVDHRPFFQMNFCIKIGVFHLDVREITPTTIMAGSALPQFCKRHTPRRKRLIHRFKYCLVVCFTRVSRQLPLMFVTFIAICRGI